MSEQEVKKIIEYPREIFLIKLDGKQENCKVNMDYIVKEMNDLLPRNYDKNTSKFKYRKIVEVILEY